MALILFKTMLLSKSSLLRQTQWLLCLQFQGSNPRVATFGRALPTDHSWSRIAKTIP